MSNPTHKSCSQPNLSGVPYNTIHAETWDRTGDLQIFGLTLSKLSVRGLITWWQCLKGTSKFNHIISTHIISCHCMASDIITYYSRSKYFVFISPVKMPSFTGGTRVRLDAQVVRSLAPLAQIEVTQKNGRGRAKITHPLFHVQCRISEKRAGDARAPGV